MIPELYQELLLWGTIHIMHSPELDKLTIWSYWQNQFSTGFRDTHGHLNIDASQQSEVVSILSAGTFFGALTAAPVADWIGRRFALIVSCFVFILGVILQTAATALPMFVAGRFFAGYGVGLVSALSKCRYSSSQAFLTEPSPTLPIRDGTKMDSRCHRRILPTRHHSRSSPRRHRR